MSQRYFSGVETDENAGADAEWSPDLRSQHRVKTGHSKDRRETNCSLATRLSALRTNPGSLVMLAAMRQAQSCGSRHSPRRNWGRPAPPFLISDCFAQQKIFDDEFTGSDYVLS